ncbi:penicillin-binding protein activator [Acuticoccus sp. I52.16.1]|uniref:penicillin-binding protein activator n=1 Tax=Acuticoccus sp. I52.16.1 TaxID=2928472 RepID=UPI001FD27F62|nr:penicillin-binding protein activator [Acuticoccus sp. I52.16.1]UOM36425.1 penicillin-binding protein activator [Acuticoccus sp. I52.16.1]
MVEVSAVRKTTIKPAARAGLLAALLFLGGCFGFGGGDEPTPDAFVTRQDMPTQPTVKTIGDGSVTVAMLLPLSAGGSASGLAQSFENAADLALRDVPTDNIRIEVRDTGGETDNARIAADQSVVNGAQLILGPVFAEAVRGAAEPARNAGIPVIAFSTDAGVAGRGVYLLSFLPKQDASRIVSYAASQGMRTFAGLVPNNNYGLVMEAAFREAVSAAGGRVTTVERYDQGNIEAAAQALTGRGAVQAVFIPNGGDDPSIAAKAFTAAGLDPKLLGSGQWANRAVLAATSLAGAWYPGPAPGGFESFSQKYSAAFGSTPPRTASLVYDATLLANGLVGARGASAFRPASLQASDGFLGVDGIFRLTRDGLSERGLAVYEVAPGGESKVISPAPTKFGRS